MCKTSHPNQPTNHIPNTTTDLVLEREVGRGLPDLEAQRALLAAAAARLGRRPLALGRRRLALALGRLGVRVGVGGGGSAVD